MLQYDFTIDINFNDDYDMLCRQKNTPIKPLIFLQRKKIFLVYIYIRKDTNLPDEFF